MHGTRHLHAHNNIGDHKYDAHRGVDHDNTDGHTNTNTNTNANAGAGAGAGAGDKCPRGNTRVKFMPGTHGQRSKYQSIIAVLASEESEETKHAMEQKEQKERAMTMHTVVVRDGVDAKEITLPSPSPVPAPSPSSSPSFFSSSSLSPFVSSLMSLSSIQSCGFDDGKNLHSLSVRVCLCNF